MKKSFTRVAVLGKFHVESHETYSYNVSISPKEGKFGIPYPVDIGVFMDGLEVYSIVKVLDGINVKEAHVAFLKSFMFRTKSDFDIEKECRKFGIQEAAIIDLSESKVITHSTNAINISFSEGLKIRESIKKGQRLFVYFDSQEADFDLLLKYDSAQILEFGKEFGVPIMIIEGLEPKNALDQLNNERIRHENLAYFKNATQLHKEYLHKSKSIDEKLLNRLFFLEFAWYIAAINFWREDKMNLNEIYFLDKLSRLFKDKGLKEEQKREFLSRLKIILKVENFSFSEFREKALNNFIDEIRRDLDKDKYSEIELKGRIDEAYIVCRGDQRLDKLRTKIKKVPKAEFIFDESSAGQISRLLGQKKFKEAHQLIKTLESGKGKQNQNERITPFQISEYKRQLDESLNNTKEEADDLLRKNKKKEALALYQQVFAVDRSPSIAVLIQKLRKEGKKPILPKILRYLFLIIVLVIIAFLIASNSKEKNYKYVIAVDSDNSISTAYYDNEKDSCVVNDLSNVHFGQKINVRESESCEDFLMFRQPYYGSTLLGELFGEKRYVRKHFITTECRYELLESIFGSRKRFEFNDYKMNSFYYSALLDYFESSNYIGYKGGNISQLKKCYPSFDEQWSIDDGFLAGDDPSIPKSTGYGSFFSRNTFRDMKIGDLNGEGLALNRFLILENNDKYNDFRKIVFLEYKEPLKDSKVQRAFVKRSMDLDNKIFKDYYVCSVGLHPQISRNLNILNGLTFKHATKDSICYYYSHKYGGMVSGIFDFGAEDKVIFAIKSVRSISDANSELFLLREQLYEQFPSKSFKTGWLYSPDYVTLEKDLNFIIYIGEYSRNNDSWRDDIGLLHEEYDDIIAYGISVNPNNAFTYIPTDEESNFWDIF
jgi:hypothetical protein